jgi:hypothetical protein
VDIPPARRRAQQGALSCLLLVVVTFVAAKPGNLGVYSSAKKESQSERPVYVLATESPGRQHENLHGSQASFMSVEMRIQLFRVSQRSFPSSFRGPCLADFIQS